MDLIYFQNPKHLPLKIQNKCGYIVLLHESFHSFDKWHNLTLKQNVFINDVSFKLGYLLGP